MRPRTEKLGTKPLLQIQWPPLTLMTLKGHTEKPVIFSCGNSVFLGIFYSYIPNFHLVKGKTFIQCCFPLQKLKLHNRSGTYYNVGAIYFYTVLLYFICFTFCPSAKQVITEIYTVCTYKLFRALPKTILLGHIRSITARARH